MVQRDEAYRVKLQKLKDQAKEMEKDQAIQREEEYRVKEQKLKDNELLN